MSHDALEHGTNCTGSEFILLAGAPKVSDYVRQSRELNGCKLARDGLDVDEIREDAWLYEEGLG
jgi:hypothetical protein